MPKGQIILFLVFMAIATSGNTQVSLEKQVVDNEFILKAKNELPVDIRLIIKDSIKNKIHILHPDHPSRVVLRLPISTLHDTLNILEPYDLTVRIGTGEKLKIKHYRYSLPFLKGKRYTLIQGFEGTFSHDSEASKYALDFSMPIGDTVCAAREGMVVWMEDQFEEGGNDRSLINKANRVLIMHDDGTIAYYVHLVKNGVLAEIGSRVQPGDPIGLSGNSGFSTKPHLHFVVLNDDRSIPLRFKRQPRKLRIGSFYEGK